MYHAIDQFMTAHPALDEALWSDWALVGLCVAYVLLFAWIVQWFRGEGVSLKASDAEMKRRELERAARLGDWRP